MKNPENKSLNINTRLFRQIQKMILAYPRAFNMGEWAGDEEPMNFDPETMKEPNCGSACCVAGWAVTLGNKISLRTFTEKHDVSDIPDRARELLGITEDQANRVFYWVGRRRYLENVTAQEAAAMIDRFLENPAALKL